MATDTKTQQATGVRTYRGRTLAEILPQIRAELGPDAIILREREGLLGGVGGFFAQRFIEVDARRGDGQSLGQASLGQTVAQAAGPTAGRSIDVYDDAPESDLRTKYRPSDYEVIDRRSDAPLIEEAPKPRRPPVRALQPQPPRTREPRRFMPPQVESPRSPRPAPPSKPVPPAQPTPPLREERDQRQRRFETDVFMERLREASAAWSEEDEVDVDLPALPSGSAPAAAAAPRPPEPRAPQRPRTRKPAEPPAPEPIPEPSARLDREAIRLARETLKAERAAAREAARAEREAERQAAREAARAKRAPARPTRAERATARAERRAELEQRRAAAEAAARPAIEAAPIATPAPPPLVLEPAAIVDPWPITEPAPSLQPAAVAAPAPLAEPAPVAEPAPSAESAAPVAAGAGPAAAPEESPAAPSTAPEPPPAPPAATHPSPVPAAPAGTRRAGPRAPQSPGQRPPAPGVARAGAAAAVASGPQPTGNALVQTARPEVGVRDALQRIVDTRRRTLPRSPRPKPLDVEVVAAVVGDLSTRGASQKFATQLISVAGAHGGVLHGSLRAAAEAEVARRIVPAPQLPPGGAAIAFIGAGGSGKTSCTAALASAYRRSSTLPVSVIALESADRSGALRKLLRREGVPVVSQNLDRAKRAIAKGRDGGVVIVDTPAVTPTDPDAVAALGQTLEALGLDAVYVALPATLGPQPARRALASFGSLRPSAVAITHADETDQLAVSIEIAISHRIPLAYLHAGTDHLSALSPVDPAAIAHHLLP